MGRRSKNRRSSSVDEEEEFLRKFERSLRRINEDRDDGVLNDDLKNMKTQIDALAAENERLKKNLLPRPGVSSENSETTFRVENNGAPVVNLIEENTVFSSVQLKDIQSSITQFSGNDNIRVENWIEDFEGNVALFNLKPIQSLILAKNSLVGSAKKALSSRPNIRCWNELKNMLLEEFSVKLSSAEIHSRLRARKKLKDESLKDYFFALREIGSLGQIEEEAIIEYCIDGIDDVASNKILLYGATTFATFREKLDLYKNFISKNQSSSSDQKPKFRNKFNTIGTNNRCFNCGKVGHISENCLKKSDGPRCFKCKKYGHKSPDCTVASNPSNSSNNKISSEITERQTTIGSVMSTNLKSNHTIIKINDKPIEALIDTGSDYTLITEDEFPQIDCLEMELVPLDLHGIGKSVVKTIGRAKVSITIDDEIYIANMYIVSSGMLPVKCIVGYDLLRDAIVYTDDDKIRLRKKFFDSEPPTCCVVEENSEDKLQVGISSHHSIVERLVDTYIKSECQEIKECPITMKLILKSDTPIWQPPRRLAVNEKIEVERQLNIWLEDGIIKPSVSDYASPIVLVNKKDGSKRICVDYRRLNREIVMDRYPLPLIEDVVDQLHCANVFTVLDLKNGFFHVKVDEKSQKYTAFVTPHGHFEFQRVPFGLCTAPAIFQRFINYVFKDLIAQGVMLSYMDDAIVFSKTVDENVEKLKNVLEVASSYGLKFNWNKCKFLFTEVEYLGYIISNGKIKPSELKIKAVSKFPQPSNVKSVQSFLGLTGYFRKFIYNYSIIARPLTDLLKKDSKFIFKDEHKESFELLKNHLINQPILSIYRPSATTELHTDASKLGYGAVLLQKNDDDNNFHPVYFFSRKTSPAESNYCSYELEVLAVVKALEKLRIYLIGISFKIITDCAAFKMTMAKKKISARIAGWALQLEEYDYVIEHRSGSKMKHADALSRNPIVLTISDEFLEQIRLAQSKDERLSLIKKILEAGTYEDYHMMRNIVFKDNKFGEPLVCVPKSMQGEVIRKFHDEGHFGTKKIVELIQRSYFIPNLAEKCDNHRQNCIECILGARKEGRQEGFLHPLPKGQYPLSIYHLDHLGPLASTHKSYRFIFSVVDSFSKFVWIYPVKSTTTVEVIQKMEVQRTVFGNPEIIISDRGTAFTSTQFGEYCQAQNIKHTLTTTGVPRGNGQIERVNGVIVPVLTKLSLNKPDEWYKHTNNLQRFLNCTWHRSIQKTPFEILFGVKMRNPEDVRIAEAIADELVNVQSAERDDMREEVRKNIIKAQEEQKRTYDSRRKLANQYNEGDLVAIKRTQFGSGIKVHSKYLGPYKIISVLRNERYKVEKVGEHEGPRCTSTSADFMKPWQSFRSSLISDDEDGDDIDDGNIVDDEEA